MNVDSVGCRIDEKNVVWLLYKHHYITVKVTMAMPIAQASSRGSLDSGHISHSDMATRWHPCSMSFGQNATFNFRLWLLLGGASLARWGFNATPQLRPELGRAQAHKLLFQPSKPPVPTSPHCASAGSKANLAPHSSTVLIGACSFLQPG
jgi:hypothetical protein